MDGLSQNFGPLSTWTDGRVDGPQTAVFVRGGLNWTKHWTPAELKIADIGLSISGQSVNGGHDFSKCF